MLRVVFDTVVFVRALIHPKSRSGRLLFEYADRFQIVMSQATAQELLEVLQRPELTRKYPALNTISLRQVIDLLSQAETVVVTSIPEIVRDPKDNIFVATAVTGRADYLVSEDKDLLVLDGYGGLRILGCREFIGVLEAPSE